MCQKQSPAATKPAARAVRPNTDLPTHVFNFAGLLTYEWPDDGSPTATSPPSAGGGEVAVGDPSSGRAFGAASLDSIGRTCKKNMLNHAVPSGTADWEASTHSKGNNCTACLLHQKCLRETTGFQSSHKKKKKRFSQSHFVNPYTTPVIQLQSWTPTIQKANNGKMSQNTENYEDFHHPKRTADANWGRPQALAATKQLFPKFGNGLSRGERLLETFGNEGSGRKSSSEGAKRLGVKKPPPRVSPSLDSSSSLRSWKCPVGAGVLMVAGVYSLIG